MAKAGTVPTVWRTVKTPAKAGTLITPEEAERVAKTVEAAKKQAAGQHPELHSYKGTHSHLEFFGVPFSNLLLRLKGYVLPLPSYLEKRYLEHYLNKIRY